MSEIVRVPFRGDTILTIDHGGRPFVILRPAVESTTGSYAPPALWSIVWDNGVVGPNYQPPVTA